MLKNALLYKDEIMRKYQDVMYDLRYQYYCGGSGHNQPLIPENNFERHTFASVDEEGNVIGFISYNVDYAAMSCCNFGACSFDIGNRNFTKDLFIAIDEIFTKYHMNRLDFWCFIDNPVRPTYQKLIEKYGGRVVGTMTDTAKLQDGELHSSIIFELTAEEYLFKTRFKRRNV